MNFYDNGFGIYIHWPFCLAKCPYCDFNSHVAKQEIDNEIFTKALIKELKYFHSLTPGRTVTSVFFGGGTPSLMLAKTIENIICTIYKLWDVNIDVEITLEANPTSIEAARFQEYSKAGINRVSVGVQSLKDSRLKFLGRQHSASEAKAAFTLAQKIFPRTSMDLIYTTPQQTLKEWEQELYGAYNLAGEHVSLYQLTIEPETMFFKQHKSGKLIMPADEKSREFYELTQDISSSNGFNAYEISNYAISDNARSKHNLLYWQYGEYIGIGPGSHGRIRKKINNKNHGQEVYATSNIKNPYQWLKNVEKKNNGNLSYVKLTDTEKAHELLLMGLRLSNGISINIYNDLATTPLDRSKILFLETEKLIIKQNDIIKTTNRGVLVLNSLLSYLLS